MKLTSTLFLTAALASATVFSTQTLAGDEKPVQHLKVADITNYAEAQSVFNETTAELKTKTDLNAKSMHEIHMITYSLEKAVAYFADNLKGEQQASAAHIAEVVELVHLGSENNRAEETAVYLEEYFKLADAFSKTL